MKQSLSSGFTLVELLIFMGLFSVILVVLSSLFAAIIQQQLENQGMSAVETDTTYVTSRLSYDFDRADAIVEPLGNGDSSQTLILEIGGQEFEYTLNGNTLELTTPTETVTLTSPRTIVSEVQFQKIGNESGVPTVHVEMTFSSLAENSTGQESSKIDTIFGLR